VDEAFATMLTVGGTSNSLGRVDEVVALVKGDRSRLEELYHCLFDEDAWVRMRAADALEKVCREFPAWMLPYVDGFAREFAESGQPSIQWHLAQIYRQIDLTDDQKAVAIGWLQRLVSTPDVDWIVAANAMDTLAHFVRDGSLSTADVVPLLEVQQHHRSRAVVKRANRLLAELHAMPVPGRRP